MRNIFYLLFLGLSLTACNQNDSESVSYKNVYSVNLNGINKKNAQLTASIAFGNQFEKTNFKLKEIDVDISIDGIDIGTYFSREPLTLKSKSEIKIPLLYSFESSKIQDDEGSTSSSYIVVLKGKAIFTDEQGNEEQISFTHKETVNTLSNIKQKRKDRKENLEEEGGLSKSETRKMLKEKKRALKLEKAQ